MPTSPPLFPSTPSSTVAVRTPNGSRTGDRVPRRVLAGHRQKDCSGGRVPPSTDTGAGTPSGSSPFLPSKTRHRPRGPRAGPLRPPGRGLYRPSPAIPLPPRTHPRPPPPTGPVLRPTLPPPPSVELIADAGSIRRDRCLSERAFHHSGLPSCRPSVRAGGGGLVVLPTSGSRGRREEYPVGDRRVGDDRTPAPPRPLGCPEPPTWASPTYPPGPGKGPSVRTPETRVSRGGVVPPPHRWSGEDRSQRVDTYPCDG